MLGERSIVCNAEGLLFRMKRLYTRCFWNKAYKNMTYTLYNYCFFCFLLDDKTRMRLPKNLNTIRKR